MPHNESESVTMTDQPTTLTYEETPTSPKTTLHVEAWLGLVEGAWYEPLSLYVELFWLPVIGPSTTWLLRRLNVVLDGEPSGVEVDLSDLSLALGLGPKTGLNAPLMRSLRRLADFHLAARDGSGADRGPYGNSPGLGTSAQPRMSLALREEHEHYAIRAARALHPSSGGPRATAIA